MTWTAVVIVVAGIILKMLSSPPSALVDWVLSKFALHPKLESKDVTITFKGKNLGDEEKEKFTHYFNEALFLDRYHIFPGNEELFLHPDTPVSPFVMTVKNRKKEMKFFVYNYDDHVDVVKQWKKKKVASYRLSSDHLQDFTISNGV